MRKLWAVAQQDLAATFANNGIWLNLIVIPIGLVFLIGLVNGGFGSDEDASPSLATTTIDVINQDTGMLGGQLLSALRADPALRVCATPRDTDCNLPDDGLTEAIASERVLDGQSAAYLLIPPVFSDQAQVAAAAVVFRSETSLDPANPALAAVQNAIARVGGALVAAEVGLQVADGLGSVRFEGYEDDPYAALEFTDGADREQFRQEIYNRAAAFWEELTTGVDFQFADATGTGGPGDQPLIGFRQSVPGMGSMYVMFNVLGGMTILLQERKQWTLQRLIVMPVARWQVMGGKMLARFLVGMIQYVVVFAVGALLGLRYNDPLALLLLMIGFAAVMTAIAFLLATVVENENQAGSLSLFLALTLAPLGGAWWPLEIVPGWMQTLAMVSPVGWVMQGFSDLLIYGRGLQAVLLPLLVLYGATAIFGFLAVRRFRYD